MPRKRLQFLLIPLLLSVLACQTLLKPVSDAQNLASTAQAIGTQALQMATEVAPFATALAAPTHEPGSAPTEVPGANSGNIFDPQGAPVSSWKDIPVMPQALAGQEVENMYSFRVNASIQEVQQFYAAQMPALGWTSILSGTDLPLLLYSKDDQTLGITITEPDENGAIVLLAFQ